MNPSLQVLLIDDNPDDRFLVERSLQQEFPGLLVEEIIDQKGLDRALSGQHFDLVITDYQLRWTDGLKVLRLCKSRWPDRPVIMFTGTDSEEIAVEAMKADLDDYVLKSPKHYARLPAAVRLALNRAQERLARQKAEAQTHFQSS